MSPVRITFDIGGFVPERTPPLGRPRSRPRYDAAKGSGERERRGASLVGAANGLCRIVGYRDDGMRTELQEWSATRELGRGLAVELLGDAEDPAARAALRTVEMVNGVESGLGRRDQEEQGQEHTHGCRRSPDGPETQQEDAQERGSGPQRKWCRRLGGGCRIRQGLFGRRKRRAVDVGGSGTSRLQTKIARMRIRSRKPQRARQNEREEADRGAVPVTTHVGCDPRERDHACQGNEGVSCPPSHRASSASMSWTMAAGPKSASKITRIWPAGSSTWIGERCPMA